MSRKERLEQMGDRAKNFTNVYLKNFGEEIDDEKLREMMEVYGKIISAKVFWTLSSLIIEISSDRISFLKQDF